MIRVILKIPAFIGATIRRGLWWFAGAELSITRRVCGERVLLDCIGTSVLGTAALAFLTGSYAFYILFEDRSIAIGFGFLWMVLIFNLDRFSVASIRRGGPVGSDLLVALPRVLLTGVIAVVIVVPLELRLFGPEIEQELPELVAKLLEARTAEVKKGNPAVEGGSLGEKVIFFEDELKRIDREMKAWLQHQAAQKSEGADKTQKLIGDKNASIKKQKQTLESLQSKKSELNIKAAKEEEIGSDGSRPGKGPKWRLINAEIAETDRLIVEETAAVTRNETELTALEANLAAFDKESLPERSLEESKSQVGSALEQAKIQMNDALERYRQKVYTDLQASLLTRITILGKLTNENLTADWAVFMLRLLVFLLETAPIFLKLLSGRSGYDYWRDAALDVDMALSAKWTECKTKHPCICDKLYPTPIQ